MILFYLDLTNYIFEDERKRIDLGLMWIYSSYLQLKRAQARLERLHQTRSETDTDEEHVEVIRLGSPEEMQRAKDDVKLRTVEYDRTLYTNLFNIQKHTDQRDL